MKSDSFPFSYFGKPNIHERLNIEQRSAFQEASCSHHPYSGRKAALWGFYSWPGACNPALPDHSTEQSIEELIRVETGSLRGPALRSTASGAAAAWDRKRP